MAMKAKMAVRTSRKSKSDRLFDVIDYAFLTLALLAVAYPLYFIVIASISEPSAVYNGDVIWRPIMPTLEGYERILSYSSLYTGYRNTIIYTLVGTAINVGLTILAA